MKKTGVVVLSVIAFTSLLWTGYICDVRALNNDASASKQLEIIRRSLSSLTEMKYADAKKHYEKFLNELDALTKKYSGTEEALEARFYIGSVHNEMHDYDAAVKCFDEVLAQKEINANFKARSLYFKAKALLAKGDIVGAKEAVSELRLIEPGAADAFGSELSGMPRIGMEAPVFNAADFNGKQVDLSKYKGNIIIIDFWATWCAPCIQEFPNVKKMYGKFKDKGVQFIGVSLDDDIEDLRGFVKQEEVEWPQMFDGKRWKGKLPTLYHVQALPTMFVLDRENKIRYIGNDTESVTRIVITLLSESKEVPLFR